MTINEIRQLAPEMVMQRIREQRVALRALMFSARQKQLKSVRDVRRTKREIAQMLSIAEQQASASDQKSLS